MVLYAVPLAAGAVMMLLAGWLLRVNARHGATQAFAFVLVARGLALASLTASLLAPSVEAARFAATLYPSLCLATIFGVVYFVGVYPARRAWLPRGPAGPLVVFLPLLVLEILIVLNPDLIRPMGLLTEAGPEAMFRWVLGSPQGPFGIAPTVLDLAMAVPAFALARDYLRTSRGKRRSTLLIVSLGFFAPAACSCLMAGAFLQLRGGAPRPVDPSVFNYVEMAVFGIWFVVLSTMLGYLGMHTLRSREGGARREAAWFAVVLVVSTIVGAATGTIPDPFESVKVITAMVGFWSVLGAALVTYGVLRNSLFDIDVRLKVSFQRSTVAAVFVAVYFLISEGAEQLFTGISGSTFWGLAAAALLLLALHPIKGFAERLVDGLMPYTRPLIELARDEQVAFYREHVDLMWMDGHLSARDRLVLANLRAKLGLDPETAEEVELEILTRQSGLKTKTPS